MPMKVIQFVHERKSPTGLPDMPTPRDHSKSSASYLVDKLQGPLPALAIKSTTCLVCRDYVLHWQKVLQYTELIGIIILVKIWSHGCVNLPIEKAEELYKWAPIGT